VTVYLVQRLEWEHNGEWYFLRGADPDTGELLLSGEELAEVGGASPLKTFSSRKKAETWCRALERLAREGLNPFQYGSNGGSLRDYSTLPPAEFRRRLADLDVRSPRMNPHGHGRLREWWQEVEDGLDEGQRNGAWDALDLVRFFSVVPTPVKVEANGAGASAHLHLVERIVWSTLCWDQGLAAEVPDWAKDVARQNPFRPDYCLFPSSWRRVGEGGWPLKAFLDPEAADAFCGEQERLAWQTCNPFRHGEITSDWSSFDAGRLRDWLLDAGLEPPAARARAPAWRKWYDAVGPSLTEVQRLKTHEALDKVRFYRVVELTE
jgi:hypothetical protein